MNRCSHHAFCNGASFSFMSHKGRWSRLSEQVVLHKPAPGPLLPSPLALSPPSWYSIMLILHIWLHLSGTFLCHLPPTILFASIHLLIPKYHSRLTSELSPRSFMQTHSHPDPLCELAFFSCIHSILCFLLIEHLSHCLHYPYPLISHSLPLYVEHDEGKNHLHGLCVLNTQVGSSHRVDPCSS